MPHEVPSGKLQNEPMPHSVLLRQVTPTPAVLTSVAQPLAASMADARRTTAPYRDRDEAKLGLYMFMLPYRIEMRFLRNACEAGATRDFASGIRRHASR